MAPRSKVVFVTIGCSAALLSMVMLAKFTFAGPKVPTHFDPAEFADFDNWECYLEEWAPITGDEDGSMQNKSIIQLQNATGALLDVFLCKTHKLPKSPAGTTYYSVIGKGDLKDAVGSKFTGTVVFRERDAGPLAFLLEPRRTHVRYYHGMVIESETTRSDL